MTSEVKIEEFLKKFGAECVEFGLYYDQFMRNEVDFGEITRRLSEATGEAEGQFANLKSKMSEEQLVRFKGFQQALESMTITLIETEINRNKEIIKKSILNSEYFLVNIIYNSIISSVNMIYANSSEEKQKEKVQKLEKVTHEQKVLKGIIKVLKVVEESCKLEFFSNKEYEDLEKTFQIYVNHFAFMNDVQPKETCDEKLFKLLSEHVENLNSNEYFGNRTLAYKHIKKCSKILELIANNSQNLELQRQIEFVRPPDPDEKLRYLYNQVVTSDGEANIYSAVTAFMNFVELIPSHPDVHTYKQKLRNVLKEKGMM